MIVTVLPIKDIAAVVEKNAVTLVIIPARGTEKAKFVSVPAAFVKSIVPPTMEIPGADEPNPTNPGVPIKPPAIVVSANGIPDA